MTAAAIRSYARQEAVESAETLGVTLADAVVLENQGALRARGEAALAVIAWIHEQAQAEGTDPAVARTRAVAFLSEQRIGDGGYFFVVDSSGDIAYHPHEEIQSQNQAETSIIQRILRQKSGYVRYYWQNPDERLPREKFSYIDSFEPWDWYVVATDYAHGFLQRLPSNTLRSLLNGYQQESVRAAFVRVSNASLIGASRGWEPAASLVQGTDAWVGGVRLESRVEQAGLHNVVAFAPLEGFNAEVGLVYSMDRLQDLTKRYVYVVAITLLTAILALSLASRIVSAFIARPVRLLSERLNRRLGGDTREGDGKRSDDLRTLILQQLRALVRLDYESRGRREAEHEAMVAESVFQHTSEGIVVTDADVNIVRVNPAFESITGYTMDELVGRNPRIFRSGRQTAEFYREMWSSLNRSGTWVGETWNRRKSGEEYPQLLSIRAVQTDDGGAVDSYVAVCHDISDRKEAEDRLHHLATHDALTGLPNRAYLNDALDYTLRQSRRQGSTTAVLFLDIDDFKDVNDSFGHDTGDQFLKWVARRLELRLRDEDIVVRFGGDEFVIVLPRVDDSEYASIVARRILGTVREPYLIGNQRIRPSVSIGIAIYPEGGRDAADLLRDADAAMYAAKRQGRNTYRFHNPGMNENAHRRLAMQGSIAGAIDRGELSVLYQPVLALTDRCVNGAEALVRWNREDRVVMPGEFLPYLEGSSMLARLDLWVLDQVCVAIKSAESHMGERFWISVNAGAYNLIQDDFVPRVTEIVSRNGVDPARIAIEVTETAAIRNFERARATLRDLQAAGFKLYLDDFGEGHSSIRYLREFGVDSVKLDRAYLTNVEHSDSARSLVRGFTQLAHGMNLQAIVEGVETPVQLAFARDAGCDFAQGFLIGHPGELRDAIPAADAVD